MWAMLCMHEIVFSAEVHVLLPENLVFPSLSKVRWMTMAMGLVVVILQLALSPQEGRTRGSPA